MTQTIETTSLDRQTHVSDVTVYARPIREKGLRVRYFGQDWIEARVEEIREHAIANQSWSYDCWHAGSVPNCYDYPALTSGVLICANPDGQVCVWFCRLPANKVTLSGVCRNAGVSGAAPLYDRRYGQAAERQAELDLQAAHAELICTRWGINRSL